MGVSTSHDINCDSICLHGARVHVHETLFLASMVSVIVSVFVIVSVLGLVLAKYDARYDVQNANPHVLTAL